MSDHQFRECIDRRIESIGAFRCARSKRAHLVFEFDEGPGMMDPALFVKGGHRLGARDLPTRGMHKSYRYFRINRYIKAHNKNSKPFVWTASPASIFEKLIKIPELSE